MESTGAQLSIPPVDDQSAGRIQLQLSLDQRTEQSMTLEALSDLRDANVDIIPESTQSSASRFQQILNERIEKVLAERKAVEHPKSSAVASDTSHKSELEQPQSQRQQVEPKPEPQSEQQPEPQSEPRSEPQSELQCEPQCEPQSEPQFEVQSEPQPEAEPEIQLEQQPEAEPETQLERQPEVEPRTQPEAEPEAQPEVPLEVPPEVQPEAQPDLQPEAQLVQQPESQLKQETESGIERNAQAPNRPQPEPHLKREIESETEKEDDQNTHQLEPQLKRETGSETEGNEEELDRNRLEASPKQQRTDPAQRKSGQQPESPSEQRSTQSPEQRERPEEINMPLLSPGPTQTAVGSEKRSVDSSATSANVDAREPPAKRAKISKPQEDGPVCTCSISRECEVAAVKGVQDCRARFLPPIRKSFAKSKSTGETRHEYIAKKRQNQNEIIRSNRDILEILSILKKVETIRTPDVLERHLTRLRDRIHYLGVYEIPPSSIETIKAKFIDPQNGLKSIIDNPRLFPWDIRIDCEVILHRMAQDDFDSDLSRGLLSRRTIKDGVRKGFSRTLAKDYPFKESAMFIGERHLRNGQWFPWQICAMRDGAHGEIEAGISGNKGLGAVSIILSSSSSSNAYADVDQGNTIWYCGTRGKNGEITAHTNLLLDSAKKGTVIRVLRSSKLPKLNRYRPAEGLRYDGLYKIRDFEVIDEDLALHRFRLEREPGQTPIRCEGPYKRPTTYELEELRKANNHIATTKLPKEPKKT